MARHSVYVGLLWEDTIYLQAMRNIQLTHEQVEIVLNALRVAEKAYNEVHIKAIEVDTHSGHAKYYYNKSCELRNLELDIQAGKLDV